MGGWRRPMGDNYYQHATRSKWQIAVPSWEKEFCRSACSMTWEQILEAKKFIRLFPKVVDWDDSSGEEAFNNAKKRYYAKMHNLPCDVALPDPDKYIDEIDWDARIDLELLADLERGPAFSNSDEKQESVVIFGYNLLENQGFSPYGWGDIDEEPKTSDHPIANDNPWKDCPNDSNGWNKGNEAAAANNGWEDGKNDGYSDWHQYNNNQSHDAVNVWSMHCKGWGTWNGGNRKSDNTTRFLPPKYSAPRFHGDYHQQNHGSRKGNA